MPDLVLGVVGTFVLSLILAYTLLRMRCRGIGPPFGRHARYWAAFIMVSTAAVSTAIGVLIGLASSHGGAAFVGVVVPFGLQFSKLPPRRDQDMLPRTKAHLLTLPFSRLYDRMGNDMRDWCDTRIAAAKPSPRYIADAAEYYWSQMGRVKDSRARAQLDCWRESIVHQIGIVRLIDLDTSPARLRAALQAHPSTQNVRKYSDDDLLRLARRLESNALNELDLFLAYAYRLGYHTMLVYPFRPGAHRPQAPPSKAQPAEPIDR
jgi:hypothetical protein